MRLAFTYLASHFGLDLLDTETVDSIMAYIEEHQDALVGLTEEKG